MEVKQKIIILSGVLCSGKSTWSKNYIKHNKNTLILNRDSYRTMLNDYVHRGNVEKAITEMFNSDMNILLKRGFNLILDNTHTKVGVINNIMSILKKDNYVVEHYLLDTSYEICIERNLMRVSKYKIPKNVMENMNTNIINLKEKINFDKIIEYGKNETY